PEDALRLVQDRRAHLVLEVAIHLERVLVEADRLRQAVVGADDRGVPTGVARGDVIRLEDSHVRDAVACREVVRGRQPVPAAADDDDVIAALRLGPTQLGERRDVPGCDASSHGATGRRERKSSRYAAMTKTVAAPVVSM